MTLAEINFIEKELFAVANLPLDTDNFPYGFDVQIKSTQGSTKWLKISPAQMRKIELVLLGAD